MTTSNSEELLISLKKKTKAIIQMADSPRLMAYKLKDNEKELSQLLIDLDLNKLVDWIESQTSEQRTSKNLK